MVSFDLICTSSGGRERPRWEPPAGLEGIAGGWVVVRGIGAWGRGEWRLMGLFFRRHERHRCVGEGPGRSAGYVRRYHGEVYGGAGQVQRRGRDIELIGAVSVAWTWWWA